MFRLNVLAVGCVLALLTACGSPKLTEASGRDLLSPQVASSSYVISLAPVSSLMVHTLTDYSTTSLQGPPAVLKQLIQGKYVAQQAQNVSYPVISGRFEARAYSVDHSQFTEMQLEVQTMPNSNVLTAQFASGWNGTVKPVGSWQGTVDPDGTIHWPTETTSYYENGGVGYIRTQKSAMWDGSDFEGKPTGQRSNLTFYDYSFTPQLQAQIVQGNGGQAIKAGSYEIKQLSDLRLNGDTQAVASVSWSVSLNDLGRILAAGQIPTGTGRVTFGKKPDGTWAVDSWCAENCRF